MAAESLESVTKKADAQKKKIDEVNIALTSLLIAKATGEGIKGAAATFIKALEDSGAVLDKTKYIEGGKPTNLSPVEIANQFLKDAKFDVGEILAEKDIVITANGDIIIDGVNLKDNTSGPRYSKGSPDLVPTGKYETNTEGDKKGRLTTSGSTQLVKDRGYVEKDFFMYNGVLYKVQNVKSRTGFDLGLGAVAQKADGGPVSGPGTSTSDSIPAYLSNGEYVVNAATVNKLGVPFFDRINGMKNGGLMLNYDIPKYENGGPMVQTMPYSPDGVGSVYKIGSVSMQFAEAPANGKQLFEEFKVAMALEQRKSNPERNISRRYNQ